MTETFNPVAGLERVEKAGDLRVGDHYVRAYYDTDGNLTAMHAETVEEGQRLDHLFAPHRNDVKVLFVKKAPRHVEPQPGHYGIATLENGRRCAGMWDADGDLFTLSPIHRDYYINKSEVVKFEDKGVVDMGDTSKTEGLVPGVDPKPDTRYVWDRTGDKWYFGNEDYVYHFKNQGVNTWDNPSEIQKQYAPYTTVRPANARG